LLLDSLKRSLSLAALMLALLHGRLLAQQSAAAPKPYVVVVVPGHGGIDSGAIFPPDSPRPAML